MELIKTVASDAHPGTVLTSLPLYEGLPDGRLEDGHVEERRRRRHGVAAARHRSSPIIFSRPGLPGCFLKGLRRCGVEVPYPSYGRGRREAGGTGDPRRTQKGEAVSKSRWDSQEASIAIPFRLNYSGFEDMKSLNSVVKLGIFGLTTGQEMSQRPL